MILSTYANTPVNKLKIISRTTLQLTEIEQENHFSAENDEAVNDNEHSSRICSIIQLIKKINTFTPSRRY